MVVADLSVAYLFLTQCWNVDKFLRLAAGRALGMAIRAHPYSCSVEPRALPADR